MKTIFSITMLVALVGLIQVPLTTSAATTPSQEKVMNTKMAVRDLWVDHIFWIRDVVFDHAKKDKKAEAQAEKMAVENAKQIAAVIEPFYGKEANEKLFNMLAGHYGAVKDYMMASFPSANTKAQKAASDKLTKNATEIADFLSGANPNLPKATLIAMLAAHGGHHMTQIGQIEKKDYAGEAKTWAMMKDHIYQLSDALVDGIAKQFPEKFK